MQSTLFTVGRFLQVVGMGVVLIGIFLSIEAGIRETGTAKMQSMAIEVKYLGIGGTSFVAGYLLCRLTSKS